MADGLATETPANGSLRNASVDRLACLFRHWAWADEALVRFEQQLAAGLEYEEDVTGDHPFGAYYHWCALLCGFGEAALEHGLLSTFHMDAIRPDLEEALPRLRACRQLLVVIPESLEDHLRLVDVIRDDAMLNRLRRLHRVFGDALREEQASRELDLLDT